MININKYTSFTDVYTSFLSKVTDDMYMQLTLQDTYKILQQLLLAALPKFEFPRQSLAYELKEIQEEEQNNFIFKWGFINKLSNEEINIISTYMIVEWIGQQLASVENVRMKYSGSDFKFTSQANHMQKLLQLKKDYQREGFHLQRLYKRRKIDKNGIYRSTFSQLMKPPVYENENTNVIGRRKDMMGRKVVYKDFSMIRGDTFAFDIVLSELKNYTVQDLFFSVKTDQNSSEYVFQKSLLNGITEIEPLTYRIRVAPQDTKELPPQQYFYDLEITLGSDVYTILMGTLTIERDITLH